MKSSNTSYIIILVSSETITTKDKRHSEIIIDYIVLEYSSNWCNDIILVLILVNNIFEPLQIDIETGS